MIDVLVIDKQGTRTQYSAYWTQVERDCLVITHDKIRTYLPIVNLDQWQESDTPGAFDVCN